MQTSNSLLCAITEGKGFFLFLIILLLVTAGYTNIYSQTFVEVVDTTNPVTTTATDGNYAGAAWIDIDNDGNLDLFVTKNFLFRNIGGGNFERLNDFTSVSSNQLGNGTSWGDYDNDGDIDLFLSGNPSIVYQNDGSGSFTPNLDGPILRIVRFPSAVLICIVPSTDLRVPLPLISTLSKAAS